MLQALVIGNGESRRNLNLELYRETHAIIGCNAIHRDMQVDHLICCDRRMVTEAIANPSINATLIYVRDSWYHCFRKLLKNKQIQHLPAIPLISEFKRDQADHWGSGCYAVLLAAHLNYDEITLIGFDLYPLHDRVNNLYKGTVNYARIDGQAIDYSYWLYHIALIFQYYSHIKFNVINHAHWQMPKQWQKNNVKFLAL